MTLGRTFEYFLFLMFQLTNLESWKFFIWLCFRFYLYTVWKDMWHDFRRNLDSSSSRFWYYSMVPIIPFLSNVTFFTCYFIVSSWMDLYDLQFVEKKNGLLCAKIFYLFKTGSKSKKFCMIPMEYQYCGNRYFDNIQR